MFSLNRVSDVFFSSVDNTFLKSITNQIMDLKYEQQMKLVSYYERPLASLLKNSGYFFMHLIYFDSERLN